MPKAYWISAYQAVHDDNALAAYDSPGYKEALAALGDNAVTRDIRIIEGV